MGVLVSTGAEVNCLFGDAPGLFAASGEDVAATAPVGVITDVEEENIATFGMCWTLANPDVAAATALAQGTLTPAPCVPVLTPWTPGAGRVTINGVAALDADSTCRCAWTGDITVSYPGQEQVTSG